MSWKFKERTRLLRNLSLHAYSLWKSISKWIKSHLLSNNSCTPIKYPILCWLSFKKRKKCASIDVLAHLFMFFSPNQNALTSFSFSIRRVLPFFLPGIHMNITMISLKTAQTHTTRENKTKTKQISKNKNKLFGIKTHTKIFLLVFCSYIIDDTWTIWLFAGFNIQTDTHTNTREQLLQRVIWH